MIGAIETINIYGPNGALLMNAPVTDNCERNETIMGDEYVSLSFYRENKTIIPSFSYLEYDGKFYFCKEDYYPKNAGGHYQYEVKFVSAFNMLDKFVFMRYVSVGEETWREAEFNINANILTIGTIIIQSIRESVKRLPDCKLKSHLSEIGLPSNNKYGDSKLQALSFSGMDIRSAITTVANTWETECWIEETGSNVYLHFDKCETGDLLTLSDEYVETDGVWKSGGLTDCSYASNKNTLVQRIIPYGSERNIIRKVAQQNVAGSIMNVSYAKRLKLDPDTTYNVSYDGEAAQVTTDGDGAFSLPGVNTGVESVEFFDDVYPRETFVIDSVAQKGNQNYPYYTITAHASSGVNPTLPIEIAEGLTLSIIFESGYLNGFEFEVRDDSKTGGALTLTIIPQTDGDDVQLPIGSFIPKEGDTFAMFNMVMPESYLTAAKQELAQEAYVKLCEIRDTVPELNCQSEPSYFVENGINIKIGTRISVESEILGEQPYVSRVISYSHSLTTPDTVSFKLCSSRIIGALAAINNAIADQTNSMNGLYQNSKSLSRRGWRDAKELADMLESLAAEMLLVGNEKWQFAISCNITILNSDGKFSGLQITAGMLQHTQPPYTERVNKGVWQMPASTYSTTVISDPNTPYYLYANVSGEINGTWLISADKKDDENHLLVGTISSEFEGQRVFNRTYGYTAITGGKITTEQIQDANRNLIIDFSSNPPRILARNGAEIIGNIKFKSTSGEYKGIEEGITENIENLEIGGNNLILNSRCDKEIPALSTTGGYLKGSYVDLLISDEVTYNGNPTLKLEQNTPIIARQTWIQFDKYKMSDNKLDASKYVFSCMMYVPATTPNPVHQDDYIGIRIYAGVSASSITTISYDLTKKGTWQKLTATFENVDLLQESDTWLSFRISCNVSVANASIKAYVSEIQLVKGNKETTWEPAPEDAQNELKDAIAAEEEARNAALADVTKEMSGLQKQIDGQIESWFESYDPTTINDPAKTWLDTNTEEAHMNDTFTNLETGASWRWGISPQTGTYAWLPIADTATQKALQEAAKAQSTADGKSTTYLSKPTSYKVGDLWILESDSVHSPNKAGEILTANKTRSSYAAADWSKKVRYTDDTAALLAQQNAEAAAETASNAQKKAETANALLSDIANDNKLTPQEKQQAKKEWDAIVAEKPLNDVSAKNYGIDNGRYTDAYNKLESYLKPLLENLAKTSDIKGSDFRNVFNGYYTERTNLLNAISSKAKQLADNAQTKADAANTLATQAKSAATAAQSAIDAMNNDSIFDVTEKQSIRTEWECISGNQSTSSSIVGSTGSYYKASKMAESVGITYENLTSKLTVLRKYLNGLALYTNSNTSNFSRGMLATNFANYYNEETALIAAVQKKIVDDVQIGGVNILFNSKVIGMTQWGAPSGCKYGKTEEYWYATIGDNSGKMSTCANVLESISTKSWKGKYVTFSADVMSPIDDTLRIGVYVRNGSTNLYNSYNSAPAISVKANEWARISSSYLCPHNLDEEYNNLLPDKLYLIVGATTSTETGQTYKYKNFKIEFGNKATAWFPAPEDTEAAISDAKKAGEDAQAAINTLNNDNVFSIVEKKAIKVEWESISGVANTTTPGSTITNNDGTYRKTILAANDAQVSTTDLTNKFGELRLQLNSYKLYDGNNTTLSAGFKTVMANKFAAYYDAEVSVMKAVQEAYTTKSIDEIEIGGVNLIDDTDKSSHGRFVGYNGSSVTSGTATVEEFGNITCGTITTSGGTSSLKAFRAISNTDILMEKPVVLSLYVKNLDTQKKCVIVINGIGNDANGHHLEQTLNAEEAKRVIFIGNHRPTYNYFQIQFYPEGYAADGTVSVAIWHIKLEEGNKPTAWSESENDVNNRISELDYLKEALQGTTEIDGGLVLTNLIKLRNQSNKENGGISGLSNDNVAFWSGGTYEEALNQAAGKSETLPVLITKDKNGYGTKFGIFKIVEDGIEVSSSSGDSKVLITSQSIDEVSVIQKPISINTFRSGYTISKNDTKGTVTLTPTTTKDKDNISRYVIYNVSLGSIGGNYKLDTTYAEISVSLGTMDELVGSMYLSNNAHMTLGNIYFIVKKDGNVIYQSTLKTQSKSYSCSGNNGKDSETIQLTIPSTLDFGKGYGNVQLFFCTNELSASVSVTQNKPTGVGTGHYASASINTSFDISLVGVDKYVVMARDGIAIIQRQDAYFIVKNPSDSNLLDIRMKGLPTYSYPGTGRLYQQNGYIRIS